MKFIKHLTAIAFVCGLLFVGGTEASAYPGEAMNNDSMSCAESDGCHITPGDSRDDNEPAELPVAPEDHSAYSTDGSCTGCHDGTYGSDVSEHADDNCLGCHTETATSEPTPKPIGHEDFDAESCVGCHNPDGMAQTKPGPGHADGDDAYCATCHDTMSTTAPPVMPNGHDGDDFEDCASCHNADWPASDQSEHATPGSCDMCHTDTSDVKPTVKPAGHENYTAEECASCHDADGPGSDQTEHAPPGSCNMCHIETDSSGEAPPAAPPGHNTTHMGGFANNVGADNAEGGSCDSCHAVHGSEDGDYLTKDVNENNKSESDETCLPCHTDDLDSPEHPTTATSDEDCARCHNIHGSTGDEVEAGPDSDCISCHAEKIESGHPDSGCASCHQTE